jgi:hypothetical protein
MYKNWQTEAVFITFISKEWKYAETAINEVWDRVTVMDGNVPQTANDIHPATLLAMADRKRVCVAGR